MDYWHPPQTSLSSPPPIGLFMGLWVFQAWKNTKLLTTNITLNWLVETMARAPPRHVKVQFIFRRRLLFLLFYGQINVSCAISHLHKSLFPIFLTESSLIYSCGLGDLRQRCSNTTWRVQSAWTEFVQLEAGVFSYWTWRADTQGSSQSILTEHIRHCRATPTSTQLSKPSREAKFRKLLKCTDKYREVKLMYTSVRFLYE